MEEKMDKRTNWVWMALLVTCCGKMLLAAQVATDRPNVLILYADDLGYGDLRCYNRESKIPTPHLDRLSRQGLRFTQGYSSSGVCSASRYALLTGRYHWRDFYGIVNSFGPSVIPPDRLTLPGMLRSQGYATAAIGKWHLGWDWNAIKKPAAKPREEGTQPVWGPEAFDWSQPIPDGPLAKGFDYYFGDDVINFPPYCWIENDKVLAAPDTMMDTSLWKPIKEGNWECRLGPMVSDWDPYDNLPSLTRRGVEFIRSRRGEQQPFFLYFCYPSPHAPIIPNDRFDGKSQAGPYGDFVVETDDSVGQLLRALEETGQAENTIVIFTADNGPEIYAYPREQTHGHWSSHPLRGLKRDIYEGGQRVPFLIQWPAVIQPNSASDAIVSQIDLLATLAAIVACQLPDNAAEDSHNLLPLITGEVEFVRSTHVHNTAANRFAIRHENWLLINRSDGYGSKRNGAWESRNRYPPQSEGAVELFDLKTDVSQKRNVAADFPEKVTQLQTLLKKVRETGYSAPRLEGRD